MAIKESKIEMLKKRIEKRKNIIKIENEKLKEDEEELEKTQGAAVMEYMSKNNIELGENLMKHLNLAADIIKSGASEKDIKDFFSLADKNSEDIESSTKDAENMEVKKL